MTHVPEIPIRAATRLARAPAPFAARWSVLKGACAAACIAATSLPAHAATLKENFDAALPAWESRWFGKYSDAINYCAVHYCLVDGDWVDPSNTVRGIAGSGIVLSSDSGISSFPITITFDPTFGAAIRAMTVDAAVYVDSMFSAWDASGNLVFSKVLVVDDYKDIPTSHYQTLRFKAPHGVARFSFSGPADGNTVIDNIAVQVSEHAAAAP